MIGGASGLVDIDLSPHVKHEITSAVSPMHRPERDVSIASSASAASCCWPDVRDGLCKEMALTSSVGRMI